MIEQSFIESGFSFTASKLLPYIIVIIMGILLVFILRNRMKFKNRIVRVFLKLILLVAPFALYFLFYPIYQGDFSNNSEQVKRTEETSEINGEKLYVLSMANCPHCKEAMTRMLLLKERNPNLEIEYVVCHTDSAALTFYTEVSDGKIDVRLAKNPEAISELANHSFPTFVLSQKVGSLKRWSNNSFGVRALDEVEALFN